MPMRHPCMHGATTDGSSNWWEAAFVCSRSTKGVLWKSSGTVYGLVTTCCHMRGS